MCDNYFLGNFYNCQFTQTSEYQLFENFSRKLYRFFCVSIFFVLYLQNNSELKKQTKTKVENKTTYTYEEAYSASLKYFNGDELAARVWASKYALKDSYGHLYEVTPDDMHHRIASEPVSYTHLTLPTI